jgi:hypothetical protein
LCPLAILFLQCHFTLAVGNIIFLIPRIASMSWKAVKFSARVVYFFRDVVPCRNLSCK